MRTGGCLCGAVRYETPDAPTYTVACHCTFCQRLTGSAFAVWPTFPRAKVNLAGSVAAYEHRSDETARRIRLEFCPRCGTTVAAQFESEPGELSLLGGTFDETGWIEVERHIWTRSAQRWVALPPGTPTFEKSLRAS